MGLVPFSGRQKKAKAAVVKSNHMPWDDKTKPISGGDLDNSPTAVAGRVQKVTRDVDTLDGQKFPGRRDRQAEGRRF